LRAPAHPAVARALHRAQAARARHPGRAVVALDPRHARGVSLLESEALVVRTVEVGESDVVATFITEKAGKVGAVVRGGRKASRRVGGALEPVHTVEVRLEERAGAEL